MTIMLPKRKILSTKEFGRKARDNLNLNNLDCNSEPQICVLISLKTWAINVPFFIGCFFDSIEHLGRRKFEEKYKFFCDEKYMYEMIEDGINQCESLVIRKET
jgi:hypothetical protein